MATTSILGNINICDEQSAENLINALEAAMEQKGKDVNLSGTYEELQGERIKQLFGKK